MNHNSIPRQPDRAAMFPVTAVVCLLLAAVVVAEPVAKTDVSARLVYVERLLTESSAAKRVDESGDPEALRLKAEARSHFENAGNLAQAGDAAAAEVELGEAIRMLTAAARTANEDVKVTKKQSDDYQSRRESVVALAAALDRIAEEKSQKGMNTSLQAEVQDELAAADVLMEQGMGDEARARLDATYEMVKASLEKLRGGDTLVRELKFESKADEYVYELDRNDTHKMLIEVLLAEKMQSSPMRATAEALISDAQELRTRAEEAAGRQRYEEAIELLEQSTKELIRAIRSAGIYIPG